MTNEVIETRIDSPVWRILSEERPIQTALFGEVPRRVELVISKQWEPLLTSAQLAQYLPLAETVAALSPNQASSAWARVIGPCLASFWRRNPRETMNAENADGARTLWQPSISPTRRELLMRYRPKKSPPDEILESKDPKHAVKYWRDALVLLCESGFLSREGEPSRSVADMLKSLPAYKWQEAWLDESVDLRPGPTMVTHVQDRAIALGPIKPKAPSAPKRRRGRPRKDGS